MHYGVPQTGRCKHTKRVKQLKLWADSYGEECFLTHLENGLTEGGIESLVLTFQDGREVICRFDESVR